MKEDQKIVIYQTEDGKTQIDVRLENEEYLQVQQEGKRKVSRRVKYYDLHCNLNNTLFHLLLLSLILHFHCASPRAGVWH